MKKTFTKQFEWVMGMTGSTSCFSPTRRLLLLLCLIVIGVGGTKAQSDVTFNEGVRYSQWVIDSRLGDFYGNTNDFGFTTYNRDLTVKKNVTKWKNGSTNPYIDYVPGLVAKATIEAAEYYKKFDWAKPWFKSVEWYGNKCTVPTSPDNLDAINASKMYFGLYKLANSTDGAFKSNAADGTASKATNQLGNALTALGNYNREYKSDGTGGYAFPANTTVTLGGNSISLDGGWFHKKSYLHEMWLDGQYMGPAMLAQLIKGYSSYTPISDNDWKLITKQFTIVWNMCWDDTQKLLYHAFCSEPRLDTWAAEAEIWTEAQRNTSSWRGMSAAGHSAAFWGRAEGWYFLALVDVLEQMQIAGLNSETNPDHDCYMTLKEYLDKLALGIAKRQDATSGCWYQLIGKDGNYSAQYYNGYDKGVTKNYLESSCTAIFAAAFLKATRLKLLSSGTDGTTTYNYEEIGTNAYKGAVAQFMKQRTDGTVDLLGCCKSAGVGTAVLGETKFRDGSNAYYLHGYDVTPTSTNSGDNYTEGKVLGAFILAATEYERVNEKAIRFSYDLAPTYDLAHGGSITAEALGSGTISYQWFNASDNSLVYDGQTFAPTKSGSYYCQATSGSTTIQTSKTTVTVSGTSNENVGSGTNKDIFSLTVTYNNAYNLASGADLNLTSAYANVTGGSALVHNGKSEAVDIIYLKNKSGNIALNGSSSSTYAKLTLDTPLQEGDVITFTSDESSIGSFYLTTTLPKNTNCPVNDGTYTVTSSDGLANSTVLYVWSNSKGKFKSITITRDYPESDSRATFTYGSSQLTFTETTEGTYTTTLEVGASKKGETITITPSKQDGATIKQGETTVSGDITITVPSTIGNITTSTYTVTSKDGTSTTKYEINVKLVKENVVLVYAQSDGKTEWTWDKTANSTKPTFTNPTLKVYLANADGTKSDQEVTNVTGIKYKSDVTDVATVNETTGAITIQENANGGAKIYAILKDNEYYNDAQTFFNILVKQGYSYSVADDATIANGPNLNESVYIKNGDTKLVKMTFGGWKWSTFEDTKDNNKIKSTYVVNGSTKTDAWNAATTSKESEIASIDGYKTSISGATDAVDESKEASDKAIYGSIRYGWFKSPVHDSDGKTTVSYPYTLPVRGSFMTFEPTMNGTLTIYILQNGAWNTNNNGGTYVQDGDGSITYEKGDIIPGQFRPHAFQVVNQRGLTVQEFSPNYSVSTKQKVDSRYYCMFQGDKDYNQAKYNNPYNVAKWTEFADYMSTKEQKRAHDSWNSGPLGAQKIIELDNGSFLAVQKGIVKYTFHVTGNETYYFFSNFSKMGFSGANFVPDVSQPQETVSDKISILDLSDVKAYNKITAKENGKIEGTDLKNYDYSINGKDIAPVAGVSIPQFYSITLTRTFTKDQWTTLTLPFNLTEEEVQRIFGKGTQLIQLNNATVNNGCAKLEFIYHEIQNVLPGHPYLIKPTGVEVDETNDATADVDKDENGNITAFTVYSKCVNPFISQVNINCGAYTFKGVPGYSTPTETSTWSVDFKKNDIFVSDGDGKLYVSGGSSYGKGYRAWFEKKVDTTDTTSGKINSISLAIDNPGDDDDNVVTTIDMVDVDPDVFNTLGIATGVYNLNGQKVSDDMRSLPKGIYIVNGKKIVRK